MKRKIISVAAVIVFLLLCVPIHSHLNDGGTVEWKAALYQVSKVHRLNSDSKTGYEEGIIIKILGIKIYDNVAIEAPDADLDDAQKDIVSWEEITPDGVDEALLFQNVNQTLLTQIATELQTLTAEEEAEERENPEIVITEGWTRVFKSERYQKVLNMGTPAMKPLYFILYKSQNAGMYEYICANALYQLSEYDFEWSNAKEFLEKFNEIKRTQIAIATCNSSQKSNDL